MLIGGGASGERDQNTLAESPSVYYKKYQFNGPVVALAQLRWSLREGGPSSPLLHNILLLLPPPVTLRNIWIIFYNLFHNFYKFFIEVSVKLNYVYKYL